MSAGVRRVGLALVLVVVSVTGAGLGAVTLSPAHFGGSPLTVDRSPHPGSTAHQTAAATALPPAPARPTSSGSARSASSSRPLRDAGLSLARARREAPPLRFAPGSPEASKTYTTGPASMGISDLGVNANESYGYGTNSFEGNLTLNSFAAFTPSNITNLSWPSPDWIALQLNAVAVNVSLPSASPGLAGTFWVENDLLFNGSAFQVQDMIMNYSSPYAYLYPSTLSGKGTIIAEYGYQYDGKVLALTLPTTIHLFDNITTVNKHTVVRFGYAVGSHAGTYDNVTFGGTSAILQPQFLVNGSELNPAKRLYDVEFVLGGVAAGGNANVVALNGTATLLEYNSTPARYQPVRAAFDFGINTVDTAVGVAVAYNGTTAQLTAGPSFLYGLWNTNGASARAVAPSMGPGWITVRIHVEPAYAFVFATNTTDAAKPLDLANYTYAPTSRGGNLTTDLPSSGGPYNFTAWADGNQSSSWTVDDNSTSPGSGPGHGPPKLLRLSPSSSTFDAPIYLLGNASAKAFALAGITNTSYSTSGRPTLRINSPQISLAAPFLTINDAGYPTFTLFAAQGVNFSVVVNHTVQAPTTYGYTNEAGNVSELTNWTQGYFFYYGKGNYSVGNTTIEGNTSLAYKEPPVDGVSTVEFYGTSNDRAGNITVGPSAIGVSVVRSKEVHVANLSAGVFALGVLVTNSSNVTIAHASASGLPNEDPSMLAVVNTSAAVTVSNVSVAQFATGVYANRATGLSVTTLAASSSAVALAVNDSSSGSVNGLHLTGGAYAGNWSDSSEVSFTSIDVLASSGLNLSRDSALQVSDALAEGAGSNVLNNVTRSKELTVQDLTVNDSAAGAEVLSCQGVNLSSLRAGNDSYGANVTNSSSVSVSSVHAGNGSLGLTVTNSSSVVGSGFVSANESTGLLVSNVTTGKFTGFTSSGGSVGVFVQNSTGITVQSVTATNATPPGPNATGQLALSGEPIPSAGAGFANDTSLTVSGVEATNYPYGVSVSNSTQVTVSDLTDWHGNFGLLINNTTHANVSQVIVGDSRYWGVFLNATSSSRVSEVFTFGDGQGIDLYNCTGTKLSNSTFELSLGLGLELFNGTKDIVKENNFIGNNGSSVLGKFNATFSQAQDNGTTDPTYADNYWADHTGSAPYVVNNSSTPETEDVAPLAGFTSTYLEFIERGLPVTFNWTVTVNGAVYVMNETLLYVPGWALPNGTVSFTVTPITYYPPHPASGSFTWAGSSQIVSVYFGNLPSSGSSFPLWLVAVIAAAAVAVIAALLVLRRRRSRPAAPPPPVFAEAPEHPSDVQRR